MKKILPCLAALLTLAAAPVAAQAEGIVLKYHFKKDITVTSLGEQQIPGRQPFLETAKSSEEKDYTAVLMPQHLSLRTGDEEKVYNFIEKTFAEVDHANKTYRLLPLHALPLANHKKRATMAPRAVDFVKRTGTAKLIKTLSGMAYDTEAIMMSLDTLYAGESNQNSAAALQYKAETRTLNDTSGKAASFTLSETDVPQGLQKTYRRFLVYAPVLHPVMEKAVASDPKFFAMLEYKTNNYMGTATDESWTLTGTEAAPDKPPAVPAGYTRRYSDNEDVNKTILVAQKDGPAPSHFVDKVKEFIKNRDTLRAVTAFYEMRLSLPADENKDAIEDLSMQLLMVMNDGFSKQVMRAMEQKQTTIDGLNFSNKALAHAAQKTKNDGGTDYTYFYDVFTARNIRDIMKLAGGGPDYRELAKAQRMDIMALFTNPWLAAAYADLGAAEYEYGDALFAWVCWEQAARLKPDLGTLDKMDAQRRLAEKEFPEYF